MQSSRAPSNRFATQGTDENRQRLRHFGTNMLGRQMHGRRGIGHERFQLGQMLVDRLDIRSAARRRHEGIVSGQNAVVEIFGFAATRFICAMGDFHHAAESPASCNAFWSCPRDASNCPTVAGAHIAMTGRSPSNARRTSTSCDLSSIAPNGQAPHAPPARNTFFEIDRRFAVLPLLNGGDRTGLLARNGNLHDCMIGARVLAAPANNAPLGVDMRAVLLEEDSVLWGNSPCMAARRIHGRHR